MCLELIKYITLDAYIEGKPGKIYINYKLLDEPLKDKKACLKAILRYLLLIRKCVTILQGDYLKLLCPLVFGTEKRVYEKAKYEILKNKA